MQHVQDAICHCRAVECIHYGAAVPNPLFVFLFSPSPHHIIVHLHSAMPTAHHRLHGPIGIMCIGLGFAFTFIGAQVFSRSEANYMPVAVALGASVSAVGITAYSLAEALDAYTSS